MQKQRNNITTNDLIHILYTIDKSAHSTNWKAQHLFWLQDCVISESVNFMAFHTVLSSYKLRDYDTYPFKAPYGQWKIFDGRRISVKLMHSMILEIIKRLQG